MTGDVVTDGFMLLPGVDPAARSALIHYANLIELKNPDLAAYLRSWVRRCWEQDKRAQPQPQGLPDWIHHLHDGQPVDTVYQVSSENPKIETLICPKCGATGQQVKDKRRGGLQVYKCRCCDERYMLDV